MPLLRDKYFAIAFLRVVHSRAFFALDDQMLEDKIARDQFGDAADLHLTWPKIAIQSTTWATRAAPMSRAVQTLKSGRQSPCPDGKAFQTAEFLLITTWQRSLSLVIN